MNLLELSFNFIHAARKGVCLDNAFSDLKKVSNEEIFNQLKNDELKKVFWINLYNGLVLSELYKEVKLNYKVKIACFRDVCLSLDEIEHGILRRSKLKLSLGYIENIKPSAFEKSARLQETDYRIHFALNCGANSCPPIMEYKLSEVEDQLYLSTLNYLEESVLELDGGKSVKVPRLCLWYLADFGGFSGIRAMLKSYKLIGPDSNPNIEFLNYDWSINPNNFAV